MSPTIRFAVVALAAALLAGAAAAQQDSPEFQRASALYAEGQRHLNAGDMPKAVEVLSEADETYPGLPPVLVMRSTAYLRLGRLAKAQIDIQEAIRIYLAGGSAFVAGERVSALEILYAENSLVAMAVGDYDQALESFRESRRYLVEKSSGKQSQYGAVMAARGALLQGLADQTEREFRAIFPLVTQMPYLTSLGDAYTAIAMARLEAGEFEAALALCDEMARTEGASADAWAVRVIVLARCPDEARQREAVRLLAERAGDGSRFREFAEGVLSHVSGRHEQALDAFLRFPAASSYPTAVICRGLSSAALGREDDAVRTLRSLARIHAGARTALEVWNREATAGRKVASDEPEPQRKAADQREREASAQAAFFLLSGEVRTALLGRRYARAGEEAERLVAATRGTSLEDRARQAAEVAGGAAGLQKRIVDAINAGRFGGDPVRFDASLEAKPKKADAEAIEIETRGGRASMPWRSVSTAAFQAMLERTRPAAKDWLLFAELAFDQGQPRLGEIAFVEALKADSTLSGEVSRRFALRQGAAVPEGGYVAFRESLVPAGDKEYLEKGMVRFQGQWVTRADKKHLEEGHQKIGGKWVPLTEAELRALGYEQIDGAWRTPDEVAALRGDWSHAFTLETEHYSIKTNVSRAFLESLGKLIEVAYGEFESFFGKMPRDQKMTLLAFAKYEDYEAYCQKIGQTDQLSAAGFAPSEPHTACGWNKLGDDQTCLETMVHEACHLYFAEKESGARMPSWMAEGMATYFEGFRREGDGWTFDHISRHRLGFMKQAIGNNATMPLDTFFGSDAGTLINSNGGSAVLFYSQAWAIFYFLNQTANERFRSGFRSYFDKLRRGAPADLLQELGTDGETLKEQMRLYMLRL